MDSTGNNDKAKQENNQESNLVEKGFKLDAQGPTSNAKADSKEDKSSRQEPKIDSKKDKSNLQEPQAVSNIPEQKQTEEKNQTGMQPNQNRQGQYSSPYSRRRNFDSRPRNPELRVHGNEIKIKEGESFENSLKKFNRQCASSGVFSEAKKRREFTSPSVRKRKKSEEARKRKFK